MNKEIMKTMGFGAEVKRVELGICPFCIKPINPAEFKDELSWKEFRISGLCQNCQDSVFNPESPFGQE